jgi:glycosyltransferase involved in cell wall biosynthesis
MEVGVINAVGGLGRLGYEQAVCCLEDRGPLADRIPPSVPVVSCAPGGRPPRIPWQAARLIRTWRPDVIHARNGGAWIDAALAWQLAGRRGRLAFSIHGWDQLGRMARRRAFLFRQIARWTHGLAAVSAETARQFAEETGIPAGRFDVLSSGIDTVRFRPGDSPRAGGSVVLCCVGRLDPVKAHDNLIDAFARAVERGGPRLELRLLGDGPCRASLEALVRERGLADRVKFLGMATDVPEQLRESDAFVLASHREGRPTSIMEAMASGLPVIATRVGSIPELVDDGRTGLLVEPGDVEGLARAIGAIAADRPLRDRLAEEARRHAVAELSLDRMIEQYDAFYRGLAGRPRPSHVARELCSGGAQR